MNIFVIGTGRSSTSLIDYLLTHMAADNYSVTIGDLSEELARAKAGSAGRAVQFDIGDDDQRNAEIGKADIVISMLPAHMHGQVARDCVAMGKHLITASYVSKEMQELDEEAKKKGVVLINEIGLDPGIDHMSGMEIIHRLQSEGSTITAFKSYTGGLVAPESNNNPWNYKFTWNPRNVVLAGQATARYLENGNIHYTPYSRLFATAQPIEVPGHGVFEGFANRDSLSYIDAYGLQGIQTMLRGTLRIPPFSKAWNAFVQLGITDDTFTINTTGSMTYAQLIKAFLPVGSGDDLPLALAQLAGLDPRGPEMQAISWTGIFEPTPIAHKNCTPAQALQALLETKWGLSASDKDMIVMHHAFEYTDNQQVSHKLNSSLVVKGDDSIHTAMAKTVGLPVAIAARLLAQKKINHTGVLIPLVPDVYEPLLEELGKLGINFEEKVV